MAISRKTLAKLTDSEVQAGYITSLAFALKSHIRKTSKRTGLNIDEISQAVTQKKTKSYLKYLTSFNRFKTKGDIGSITFDSVIKKMVAIPTRQ